MKKSKLSSALLLGMAASTHTPAQAEAFSYEASVTVIGQTAPNLNSGLTASSDLFLSYEKEAFALTLHVEGATTPPANSPSSVIEGANTDAGTAFDKNDKGTIQLSEIIMEYQASETTQLIGGVMLAPVWLDASETSNNENTQFITGDLTGNSTIEMPIFAPAFGVILSPNEHYRATFYASSTVGLNDTAERTYSAMFKNQPELSGLFSAAQSEFIGENAQLTVGVWHQSAPHTSLKDSTKTNLTNYGLYSVYTQHFGENIMEARLGYANPEVSEMNQFVSVSYQIDTDNLVNNSRYGIGFGHSRPSSNNPANPITNIETYWALPIADDIEISPIFQYFKAPVSEHPSLQDKSATWIASLRLYAEF